MSGSETKGWITVALVAAAAGTVYPAPISSATPWPTTEWQVHCYRPTCEQWYGDSAPCADRSTSLEWEGYDDEVTRTTQGWDGSLECRPSGGPVVAAVKQTLEQASAWLQSHGFPPPLLPRPEGKYIAFVTNPYHPVSVYGAQPPKDANGNRIPRPFYVAPQPGLEEPEYRTLILLKPTPKDVAHELFHAVQYNSPAWAGGYGSVAAWIEEGTAEAVGVTFAQDDRKANRPYDEILHWNASPGQAYEDRYFWRQVGRQIGSADDISYLQRLLAKTKLEGLRGLKSVDAVLKEPGKGLYEELPTFFSDLDVDRGDFGNADQNEIEMPAEKKRHEKEFRGRVEEVAGSAHKLRVRRASQRAKQLEVEISFNEDHEDLHLIVDGYRYDGGLGPRNLFRDLIVQGDHGNYDVVVANVAPEAVKSRDRNYDLKVQLREVDWCSMTARVTGDIGGSYFGDVAHFSTKGGATVYGAFSNPEMVEGVADWMAKMAERAGGEEAGDQMRAQKEEWLNEIEEIPRETFGLSLSEQKLDADDAQTMAFIAGGFTLQASVIGPEVGEGVTGKIPLKMLRVVPGPRAESTFDQVPFVWAEGAPGSAQLIITRNTGDLVVGQIAGTLYAEGYHKPDGSKPVIEVQASFVALEGPNGCMPGAQLPF